MLLAAGVCRGPLNRVWRLDFKGLRLPGLLKRTLHSREVLYGSFRKLGVPTFWGPYNKDPTI